MKTLFLKPKYLLICALMIAFSTSFCSAVLQIEDTFDNCPSDIFINDGITNEGRQSGILATMEYAGDGDSTSTVYLVEDKVELTEGFLIRGHNSCFISPNHNFNDIGENFTVELDARLIRGGSWAGFSIGIGAEDQHEVIDSVGTYPLNGHVSGINWWLNKYNDSGASQLLIGGVNYVSDSHKFYNAAIANILDEDVHITAIVHTKSFGGTDKVITALFVNGEPMVGDATGVGAMYVLNKSFTNNYIVIGYEAGLHDTTATMDNFAVRATTPRVAESTWTNDSSSSISFSKTYTHAVNIGYAGDVIINGVTFTGSGSGSMQAGTDWALLNYGNDSDLGIETEDNSSISGTSSNLVSDCAYSVVNSTLILSNLVAGENYTLTLFNNASSASALNTYLIPSDSEAAVNVVDQNQSQGSIFRYDYDAPGNGVFAMTFNNTNGFSSASGNWRLYAFSNEATIPECSLFIGILTMAGLFIRRLS